LTGQLAPGYALRELARQPTRTRTNYPEEWHSTENFGLDWFDFIQLIIAIGQIISILRNTNGSSLAWHPVALGTITVEKVASQIFRPFRFCVNHWVPIMPGQRDELLLTASPLIAASNWKLCTIMTTLRSGW
ncbi:MAG: hypothetical protein ACYCPD_11900, partial [Acidobacteriaceae bacterium]